jgi:hypothetical protein
MASLAYADNAFRVTTAGWKACTPLSIMDAEVALAELGGKSPWMMAPLAARGGLDKFKASGLLYLYGKTIPEGKFATCSVCTTTLTEGCILFSNPMSGKLGWVRAVQFDSLSRPFHFISISRVRGVS